VATAPGIGTLGTGGGCKLEEPVMNNLILSIFADVYISLQCQGTECLHYSQVSGYVVSVFVFCPFFYLVRLGHSILLMRLLCRDRRNQITRFRLRRVPPGLDYSLYSAWSVSPISIMLNALFFGPNSSQSYGGQVEPAALAKSAYQTTKRQS
jgi:hypothetical protein